MQPDTITTVASPHLACDGGNGALGHPRVYLHIGAAGAIDCPYCGRRYVLADAVPHNGHTYPYGE